MRALHHIIATALGTGYSPVAPGTAGSLLAVVIIYALSPLPWWILVSAIVILFVLGVYSSGRLEKEHGPDPSLVVIDEVVGMAISLLFLPRHTGLFLLAFILFRFFDIVKPPPINQSQQLPGGWGIMLDDVLAGLYALLGVHLIKILFF